LFHQNKAREQETLMRSRAIARSLNLQMKLSEVEYQADGRKATFFYTADDRVDFREMIKALANDFKIKVEMRQIGIRQEAGKVGGIGSCGRELCCSTWLTDFKSVTTTAARYQNLSINQTKLSGQCGRLKCCLNYELDTYLDALQHFPDNAENIQTTKGNAHLIKKDIFKNLMWYMLPDNSMHYPLTIKRVKEIQSMNARGERPDDLQPVDLTASKAKEIEPVYVDLVGQISLRSLERNDRKRKDRERGQENRSQQPREQQGRQQEARRGDARPQGERNQNTRNEGQRQQDQGGQRGRNQEQRNPGNQQTRQQQPKRPPQQRPTLNRPTQQQKPPEAPKE
jgi:cell fate regulator YaaT (PSP1 superfamily)